MLDVGFRQQVLFRLALAGRVEDLLLDDGVDRQLGADLPGELLLLRLALGGLELLEKLLDLAVVGLEQGDGVGLIGSGHWKSPLE